MKLRLYNASLRLTPLSYFSFLKQFCSPIFLIFISTASLSFFPSEERIMPFFWLPDILPYPFIQDHHLLLLLLLFHFQPPRTPSPFAYFSNNFPWSVRFHPVSTSPIKHIIVLWLSHSWEIVTKGILSILSHLFVIHGDTQTTSHSGSPAALVWKATIALVQ